MPNFPFQLLAPPSDATPAEWVDEGHVILSQRESAVPGVLSLDLTPYARGMLDLIAAPHVRVAWLMKCVQGAGSQIARLYLGARMDLDPAPTMIVFPSEASARETIEERVRPMFENSPRLSGYLTGRKQDLTRTHMKLTHSDIYIGWSGSPQALATRPVGILVADELDKWVAYRGVETDPISLALRRLTTYRRSKAFGLSTPTIPTGPIATKFKGAGCRYYFEVPCQACGEFMRPEWERVDFEGRDSTDPEELEDVKVGLESGALVPVYLCPHCEAPHTPDEYREQVRAGEWRPDGNPQAEEIAFHLHGLVSPFPKMGVLGLAKSWVAANLGGIAGLQDFYNNSLGLPFWDESVHGSTETTVGAATVWRKTRHGYPPGVVPSWAHTIVAGVDAKKRGHYYVVRAFGEGWRSRLLEYGETEDSESMYAAIMRDWHREDGKPVMRVRRVCLDSHGGVGTRDKSRTDEIYRFCKRDPVHLFACRGYGGGGSPSQPVTTTVGQYHPPGESRASYEVTISTLDTTYFKDLTAARINDEFDDLWQIHGEVGQDYVMQVCAEVKKLIKTEIRLGERRDIWRWVTRTPNAANHLWDCEVLATAAAHMLDIDLRTARARSAPRRYKPRTGGDDWKIGR